MNTNPSQKLLKPKEQPYPSQAAVQHRPGPVVAKTARRPPEMWAHLSRFAMVYVAFAWSMTGGGEVPAVARSRHLLAAGWPVYFQPQGEIAVKACNALFLAATGSIASAPALIPGAIQA